jgi:asparagine synthase (glutamine-hydrolysing)
MCGINGYIARKKLTPKKLLSTFNAFERSSKRGRDNTVSYTKPKFNLTFSRLAIHDKSNLGNQPFIIEDSDRIIYVVANGEIYNYQVIVSEYNLFPKSSSDCEVIPLLFSHFKKQDYSSEDILQRFSEMFDCELSFVLYEEDKKTNQFNVYLYTDHCSIRPLFYAWNSNYIFFGSTLQSIPDFVRGNITEDQKILSIEAFMTLHDWKLQRIETGSFVIFKDVFNSPINPISTKYFSAYKIPSYIGIEMLKDSHIESYKSININNDIKCPEINLKNSISDISDKIYNIISESVIRRLSTSFDTDAIGALLSGGIDSSIVCSIAATHLKKSGHRLHTFCIGMEGSKDIAYAKQVSEFIGSIHTSIELTEKEFLDAIPDVVKCIDSYDITSVRASVGQYLSAKYISKHHPNIKILLCGDGADEVFFSYLYCLKAPTPKDYHIETCKLIDEIHHFDGRRADRCISNFNIEARFPFLSRSLIEYVLNLLPEIRQPQTDTISIDEKQSIHHKWEKWILRKSAEKYNLLPKSVLWRIKTAFSDGVSSNKKLWYKVVQDHIDTFILTQEFNTMLQYYNYPKNPFYKNRLASRLIKEYEPETIQQYIRMAEPISFHLTPKTKEAYYYRKLYNMFFGNSYRVATLLPKLWLPNWSGEMYEPSATALDVFKEN